MKTKLSFRRVVFGLILLVLSFASLRSEDILQMKEISRPYSIQKGTTVIGVDAEAIFDSFRNYDILIFGEEHDDVVGHKIRLDWFKKISASNEVILSLEMLERDQQKTLDEYLSGQIGEKTFFNSLKLWPNHLRDYHPFLQYAKEHRIPVIASNVPKKYANLVSSSGLETLFPIRSVFLPPKYLIRKFSQEGYETKIKNALQSHPGASSDETTLRRFIDAQSLWDAGMTDSIANAFLTRGKKIVHINGRFHSDEGFGVTHRLRELGFKVITVSMFPLGPEESIPTGTIDGNDFTVVTERKEKEN
ncbi:ChaN family lipoprotein [Leptospira adleri]|uniref:ChaN family lipoprotein n=1 Tax=Leptospira adleri TaxID=2023186 RepID=UPI003B8A8DFB